MNNSAMKTIKNKINNLPFGSAFVVSDFTSFTDYQNAKKCLLRLEKEKFIRRVIRGVYDKPYYSPLIDEYASPQIEEIAKCLARNYSWQIAPSGLTSLNLLGLSNQVANSYEYYSSGQYKSYTIGNIVLSFKHKSSKELFNLSYKSSLVIQAIKEIGSSIDEQTLNKLSNSLSKKEKDALLKETSGVTKWIYEKVKIICRKDVDVMKNNKVAKGHSNPHYKAYLETLDIISKLNPDPEVNKKSFDELYDEMMEEKHGSSRRHK